MNTLVYIVGASLIAQASYVLHDAMERGPSWLPANMWLFNKLYALAGIGLVGVVLGAGLAFRWQIAIGVILASQVGSWLIGRIIRRANHQAVPWAALYLLLGVIALGCFAQLEFGSEGRNDVELRQASVL